MKDSNYLMNAMNVLVKLSIYYQQTKNKERQKRSQWRLRHLRSKPANRLSENQNHKTTWLKGHVTLKVAAYPIKSQPRQVWWH